MTKKPISIRLTEAHIDMADEAAAKRGMNRTQLFEYLITKQYTEDEQENQVGSFIWTNNGKPVSDIELDMKFYNTVNWGRVYHGIMHYDEHLGYETRREEKPGFKVNSVRIVEKTYDIVRIGGNIYRVYHRRGNAEVPGEFSVELVKIVAEATEREMK